MPRERWQPVVGFEGLYEVSSLGRVKSLHGHNRQRGHILRTPLAGGCGGKYPSVSLCRDGGQRCNPVHKLVAAAFLGSRPTGHEIDHVNGKKTDNRASNLEYVTVIENHARARRLGLLRAACGEDHGNARLTKAEVRYIRRLKKQGWTQRRIAQHLGLGEGHVSRIVRRKLWSQV